MNDLINKYGLLTQELDSLIHNDNNTKPVEKQFTETVEIALDRTSPPNDAFMMTRAAISDSEFIHHDKFQKSPHGEHRFQIFPRSLG